MIKGSCTLFRSLLGTNGFPGGCPFINLHARTSCKDRVHASSIFFNTSTWMLQRREKQHLQIFTRHYMATPCLADASTDQETVMAYYATQLFAPLNDGRFKPGLTAQRTRGMMWNAWLGVETATITEYAAYLLRFADYESSLRRAKQALERARMRWVDERLESKFKNSKAFKRCEARSAQG